LTITGTGGASTLAKVTAETFPSIRLLTQPNEPVLHWSEIVEQKKEIWPIQYLIPGGAYIHSTGSEVK